MSPIEHEQRMLHLYRKQLDLLNRQLLHLLEFRGSVVLEVGRLKRNLCLPVHDPDREESMLNELCQNAAGPFSPGQIEQIFGAIFAASRLLGGVPTRDEGRPLAAPQAANDKPHEGP